MESLNDNKIIGIPVTQNKQEFIIGVFKISQILKFTRFTERLIVGYNDDNKPIYNKEIQRKVENSRVEKIADFLIEDPEATFPTNIVLSIPAQVIESQSKINNNIVIELNNSVFNEVKNPNGDIYITIIDGQHRIKGIEVAIKRLRDKIDSLIKTLRQSENSELQERLDFYQARLNDLLNIELLVSFFIDKTLEFQAMIFSTINRTQKRVSQNLVYSLFGLTTDDSPQKTALEIVLALNSHPKSPFYNRIKLYGGEYSRGESPPLSQATMVRSIIDLICENLRESELDRYRKRKDLFKTTTNKFLPFRKYYANNQDDIISDTLFYFFKAVQTVYVDSKGISYWLFDSNSKTSNILQTTVGYEALLKILIDIITYESFDIKQISIDYFSRFLSFAADTEFENQQIFPFSTKGKNILYLTMSLKILSKSLPEDLRDERKNKLNELLASI